MEHGAYRAHMIVSEPPFFIMTACDVFWTECLLCSMLCWGLACGKRVYVRPAVSLRRAEELTFICLILCPIC